MAEVKDHYDNVLSEVYTWLNGGFYAAKSRNTDFFQQKKILPRLSGKAVDLGAGSGFQSVPLAELGFSVTAIDLNASLLQELKSYSQHLDIKTVRDDLLQFQEHIDQQVELIVCMTDTVLHLTSKEQVIMLMKQAFDSLESSGKLLLTFRDLTQELIELERFIPVKSDESTVFMCFLEYEPETVKAHDIVYQRIAENWQLKKSFYRKIRLSREWVENQLRIVGFSIVESTITNGMISLIAER